MNRYYQTLDKILAFGKNQTNKKSNIRYWRDRFCGVVGT